MTLLAILIGIVIERLATRFLQWRRLRWLDRIIDAGFRFAGRVATWPAMIPVVTLVVILVLPVALVIYSIGDTLQEFAYLLVAIVVLLLSIGPSDIGEQVDDYCRALRDGDDDKIRQAAKAIVEDDVPEDERARIEAVEAAVCVQANNRLFAVIFWFLLGPLVAWAYRVTDLVRRRAVFSAARAEADDANIVRLRDAAETLHGWLAWIPARLTALGYVTAGHADEALAALRAPSEDRDLSTSLRSEHLLARVGSAALALHDREDESLTDRGIRGAIAANKLVFRLLMISCVIIAAMTLYGFTR